MSWTIVSVFFVAGDPVAQPRQRHRVITKGGRAYAMNYTTKTAPVHTWKDLIALRAEKHLPDVPIDKPIRLSLVFWFRRPKSHYRTGKNAHLLKDSAPAFHTKKPDFDNCAKSVADIMTQIGFWRDDAQLMSVKVKKLYQTGNERPGVYILVEEWNN